MTRVMCVRLTRWPIDRARRRLRPPGPRPDHTAAADPPLALVDGGGGRRTVAVACDRAAALGVRAGMSIDEARARCQGLTFGGHDPAGDDRGLIALGRWLGRFGPVVAPDPPDAVFLDVDGTDRLFGGPGAIARRAGGALAAAGIGAVAVVAPHPAAARALAWSADHHGRVVADADLRAALAPLPTAALGLDPADVAVLADLGVETVGQLLDLPREALPSRFGPTLLRQVDRVLGRVADPLVPLGHEPPVAARIDFDGAVEAAEVVWAALRDLSDDLAGQLARRGLGARRLDAELRTDRPPPVRLAVRLGRPARDPALFVTLLRHALEAAREAADGFTALRLRAADLERLGDAQDDLFGDTARAAAEAERRLVEALSARLGPGAVARPVAVESHLPERAYRLVEPLRQAGPRPEGGSPDRNRRPRDDMVAAAAAAGVDAEMPGPRPLHLLARPVELSVTAAPSPDGAGPPVAFGYAGRARRVTRHDGPERIAGVWWDGHHKTRDYYEVEDQDGRRYWLFRVVGTGRWFLHGLFD